MNAKDLIAEARDLKAKIRAIEQEDGPSDRSRNNHCEALVNALGWVRQRILDAWGETGALEAATGAVAADHVSALCYDLLAVEHLKAGLDSHCLRSPNHATALLAAKNELHPVIRTLSTMVLDALLDSEPVKP